MVLFPPLIHFTIAEGAIIEVIHASEIPALAIDKESLLVPGCSVKCVHMLSFQKLHMMKSLSNWLERRRLRNLELQAKESAKALKLQIEKRILPLGYLRMLSLACTSSDSPRSDHYFAPPEGADVFAACRNHAMLLWERFHDQPDPWHAAICSVPRLLSGDLAIADMIPDHLPERPYVTDHGAGFCLVLPVRATAAVLPMPETLKDQAQWTWLAGSLRQADVRAWLNEHRHQLQWDDKEGIYRAMS